MAFGEPATALHRREADQTWSFRGSKSRNKVSVGEPAEGSLLNVALIGCCWSTGALCTPVLTSNSSICAPFVVFSGGWGKQQLRLLLEPPTGGYVFLYTIRMIQNVVNGALL